MAALDFPTSPTLNQVYSANGRSWIWDGTAWNPYGSGIADGDRGDITVSAGGSQWGIDLEAVDNTKLANMAEATIKGRAAGAGTGDPTDLSSTQATAILNAFVGDSGTGGTKGLVPAPAPGDATKFLKGDGTWATVSGSGDVSGPASSTTGNFAVFADGTGKELADGGTPGDGAFADFGSGSGDICEGNDARLSDARTPTAHASSHVTGGSDKIRDATASQDGLMTAAFATKLNGIEAGADVTDAGNVGSVITSATAKTTPVDADTMPLSDSAASNALKKVSWANIKATLKTYFDTLYPSGSGTSTGTNTGDQNLFGTIAVSGQSNVVADSTSDTLTLVAGSNVTITTDATTDSITIAASGGGGISDGDKGDITVSSSGTVWAIDNDVVDNAKAANMAAWTVKVRNNAASGDPQDVVATDLTEETTPAAGDFLLGWESGGALRKFDIGDLPSGGGGGASTDTRLYTANDTWTNPSPSTPRRVFVRLVGGGGGGGSGRKGAASSVRCGGGGGSPGGVVEFWVLTTDLAGTESVTVGAGGTGGAAQTTNSTNGNNGSAGGSTTFASTTASGGNGGGGGTNAAGTAGAAIVGAHSIATATANTVAGAAASATGGAGGGAPTSLPLLPTGGGAGGGVTTGNAQSAGSAGGTMGVASTTTQTAGGTAGTAGGTNGGAGIAARGTGTGGGGGGSNLTGNGGDGGNGGGFGSGGGGGGAAVDDTGNSGKGGDGAPGYALIITYL